MGNEDIPCQQFVVNILRPVTGLEKHEGRRSGHFVYAKFCKLLLVVFPRFVNVGSRTNRMFRIVERAQNRAIARDIYGCWSCSELLDFIENIRMRQTITTT